VTGDFISASEAREKGLVKGVWTGVKILGNGKIDRKLELKVNRITKSAKEAVEKAGCKLELVADQIKWQRPDTRAVRRTAKKK
jgi:large subunit ribosomal protein L15